MLRKDFTCKAGFVCVITPRSVVRTRVEQRCFNYVKYSEESDALRVMDGKSLAHIIFTNCEVVLSESMLTQVL